MAIAMCYIKSLPYLRGVGRIRDSYANPKRSRGFALLSRILPTPLVFISGYASTGKKLSIAFIKYLPLKTTTQKKIKKFILLIKTYLPITLIWQWDFSTDQSKLTCWKCGDGVFTTWVSLSHNHVYILMQTGLSANQSMCTILVIL